MDPVLEGILGLADLTLHRGPGAMGLGGKIVLHGARIRRVRAIAPVAVPLHTAVKPTVRRPGLVAPPNASRFALPRIRPDQPADAHADQRDRNRVVAHTATKISSEFHATTLSEVFHGLIDHRPRCELLLQRVDRGIQAGSGLLELPLDLPGVRRLFLHETCSFTSSRSSPTLGIVFSGASRGPTASSKGPVAWEQQERRVQMVIGVFPGPSPGWGGPSWGASAVSECAPIRPVSLIRLGRHQADSSTKAEYKAPLRLMVPARTSGTKQTRNSGAKVSECRNRVVGVLVRLPIRRPSAPSTAPLRLSPASRPALSPKAIPSRGSASQRPSMIATAVHSHYR